MTSLPLEAVGPVVLSLAAAVAALWRQLIVERKDHAQEIQAERARQDQVEAELRAQLKQQIREQVQYTEFYLRSLEARRPKSLPPEGQTP
ncbi:MAG TPA: hypothetical protein VFQ61_06360 [Polyangiaceae bacterium]|nr:hypothetical protein [Polyangiaceae bacterium]